MKNINNLENIYQIRETKERDSNFELLRILSMIMIIFHHFAVHSGIPYRKIIYEDSI